jgi:tetratricopeptide (TPR) repeat protein
MTAEIEVNAGNLEQARQPYMQALALYRALDQRWEIAQTLHHAGNAAQGLAEFDRAKDLYQESLVVRRELGDQNGIVWSLMGLSTALESLGRFDEAERLQREVLAIARERKDPPLLCVGLLHRAYRLTWKGEFAEARLLLEEVMRLSGIWAPDFWAYHLSWNVLGMTIAHLGEYKRARIQLQEAFAGFQEPNLLDEIGFASLGLGHIALAEEQYDDAQQWLQESVVAFQERGARSEVGWPLALMAGVARGMGRLSEARERLCQTLQIAAEIRDLRTAIYGLPVAALLLADQREAERAVEIYALASRYGYVAHSRLWEDVAGRQIAALAATLLPNVVTAAQERGRARDLEQTVRELLSELSAQSLNF